MGVVVLGLGGWGLVSSALETNILMKQGGSVLDFHLDRRCFFETDAVCWLSLHVWGWARGCYVSKPLRCG